MRIGDSGRRELEQALAANYERLTPGQRRVIDHLLSDTRYAAVISAAELAQEVGVSESTVTRAAQALGFAGYPDLQLRLREQFVSPLLDRIEANIHQLGDTTESAAIRVMLEDAESVQQTAEELHPDTLRGAVDALVSARRVFVVGSRGSYGLALMLGMGLRLLIEDAQVIHPGAGDLADQLMTVDDRDALVGISFRRVDRVTARVIQYAHQIGVETIAITDMLHNPIARLADHTLIARLAPIRLMPSFAPGASLVNALITAVSLRTLDSAADRIQTAERLWELFETHIED